MFRIERKDAPVGEPFLRFAQSRFEHELADGLV